MAGYDPDANVTLDTGSAEEERSRVGLAAQERLAALKHSSILIPDALRDLVLVRQSAEEGMVVRILRGGSPKSQAKLH